MRIDAHQHFWKFDPVRDSWITDDMAVIKRDFFPEHLEPILRHNGLDGCIAVQADQSVAETNFLISLGEQNTFVKGVVGWVDFFARDLKDQLAQYHHNSLLKGFRHIVQAEPKGFLTTPEFINGIRELRHTRFTYDLLIYHYQLDDALYFLIKTPDLKIVVDHIAKPSIKTGEKTHWELNMAAVASFKNVYCKISGMVTEADWKHWSKEQIFPFLDEILETFGPTRMMYGSDWPVCLLAATYEQQLRLITDYIGALSGWEQQRIMGGTAKEFYNL